MRWLQDAVTDLADQHLLRTPVRITPHGPSRVDVDGRAAVLFCGNDYLGLRFDPSVRQAALAGVAWGSGAGASRLISGNVGPHEEAERAVADLVGAESALLSSSGFAANIGALPALAADGDVIFSDALNHASLVDGCRLAQARTVVFDHRSIHSLRTAIASARPFRRGWVLTESLFSMDGDLAPLREYADLCADEDLHLYVDEAHALGVLGPEGRGACAEAGVRPAVLVGTLGKAFGCAGAFVAGDALLRTYLWNRSRTHVFSTGVAPSVATAATAAVGVALSNPSLRADLRRNITHLRTHLSRFDSLAATHPDSPILPLVVGDERRAISVSRTLLEAGYFVAAIRPPTVPRGTARLRITVSAAHTASEIDGLANALGEVLRGFR